MGAGPAPIIFGGVPASAIAAPTPDDGPQPLYQADQLKQVIAFCSKRYNENRDTRPRLAKAHLAIINRANDVKLTTYNFGDLLDFLSKPQSNPDLAKACKEVLEHVGTAPRS